MSNCPIPPPVFTCDFFRPARGGWIARLFLVLALWCSALAPAWGSQADDDYLRIYGVIEQGDELAAAEKSAPAIAKYQEADKALREFRRTFPSYNPKMVSFRLNYLTEQITKLSRPKLAPETNAPAASEPIKAVDRNQPQLKLLNPGAEPRTVLRLQPQPGDKQSQVLTMKMGMGLGPSGQAGQAGLQKVEIPPLKMNLDVEVKSVSESGDIVYAMAYRDFGFADETGADPQILAAMKGAMGNLAGFTAVGTNNNRGFSKGVTAKIPAGVDPQMQQMLDQMNESLGNVTSPLPEEAVGLGAKWETKMPIKSQGMTIEQTYVSELVELDGDRATVKVSLSQRAANQKVSNPSMPGLKMDLVRMTGTGRGESTLDLKQLLPTKASLDTKTEVTMAVNAGNQKQTMKMTMDLGITLQDK